MHRPRLDVDWTAVLNARRIHPLQTGVPTAAHSLRTSPKVPKRYRPTYIRTLHYCPFSLQVCNSNPISAGNAGPSIGGGVSAVRPYFWQSPKRSHRRFDFSFGALRDIHLGLAFTRSSGQLPTRCIVCTYPLWLAVVCNHKHRQRKTTRYAAASARAASSARGQENGPLTCLFPSIRFKDQHI
jgi:hypothetical protein